MNTTQIKHALRNVPSFAGVYPSDMLPAVVVNKPSIYIINIDPHYLSGSHWVAVYFKNQSTAHYFDSFGLPPYVPRITIFIRRNSLFSTFNSVMLQGLRSNCCGQYCCLYAYYSNMGCSLQCFVEKFQTSPDRKAVRLFRHHFGRPCGEGRGVGQRCLPGRGFRK